MKSAYGLSEAPRLWYLRARKLLLEAGFEELSMAKATFVVKSKKHQQVQAILRLHVDDGLLVVCRKVMEEIKKSMNDHFAFKEWKNLEQVSEDRYDNFVFTDDMSDYIDKLGCQGRDPFQKLHYKAHSCQPFGGSSCSSDERPSVAGELL